MDRLELVRVGRTRVTITAGETDGAEGMDRLELVRVRRTRVTITAGRDRRSWGDGPARTGPSRAYTSHYHCRERQTELRGWTGSNWSESGVHESLSLPGETDGAEGTDRLELVRVGGTRVAITAGRDRRS